MENNFDIVRELLDKRMYLESYEELQKINVDRLTFLEKAEYEFLTGIVCFEITNISEAITKFENPIKIAKEHCPEFNLYNAYYELSISYFSIFNEKGHSEDLEKSVDYCKLALDIAINNSLVRRTSGLMVYTEDSPEAFINALIHLGVLYQSSKRIKDYYNSFIISTNSSSLYAPLIPKSVLLKTIK